MLIRIATGSLNASTVGVTFGTVVFTVRVLYQTMMTIWSINSIRAQLRADFNLCRRRVDNLVM